MTRQFTKYNWYKGGRAGLKLAKNQLVWSIINDYIKSNHITQYSQLISAFPNSIRAGRGLLRGYDYPLFVTLRQSQTDYPENRFYDTSDKIFRLQDANGNYENYVVNKNWGVAPAGVYDCWQEFLDTAEAFGYEITEL